MTRTDVRPRHATRADPDPAATLGLTRRAALGLWLGAFVTVVATLVLRNTWIFRTPVTESGDAASNSILALEAERFQLLVGNYSRVGFHHPGPAFLYVDAWGEQLFHDLLHLVPAPYNGQLVGLYVFNAALVASTVLITARWLRTRTAAWIPLAVVVVFAGSTANLLSWNWMPYFYVAPFLLLVTSAASIVAGRLADLPFAVLAGGFLLHGHVAFGLFVGGVAATVVLAVLVDRGRAVLDDIRAARGAVIVAAGLVGLFLLPIVLDLVLRWPGEWAKYLDYASGDEGPERAPRSAGDVSGYVLGAWLPDTGASVALVVLVVAGLAGLALTDRRLDRRRYAGSILLVGAVGTVLMVVYAAYGIDNLAYEYLGIFYRTVPLLLLAFAGAYAVDRAMEGLPARPRALASALVLAATAVTALWGASRPGFVTPRADDSPQLQAAVDAVQDAAGERTVLLTAVSDSPYDSFREAPGIVLESQRRGLRVCFTQEELVAVTSERTACTASDRSDGLTLAIDVVPHAEAVPAALWRHTSSLLAGYDVVILEGAATAS